MKRVMFIVAAVLVVLAFGIASAAQLTVKNKEGVGPYLADSKGMTLYIFKKDSTGKSMCEGECVTKWPIFYDKKIKVPKDLSKKDFSSIKRADGKKQTTYKGMPLYYFFKDANAGDTNGQGVNNVWYVVDPATFKP